MAGRADADDCTSAVEVSVHRDCPFCHLATERVVAETSLTLTLRDGFPVSAGRIRIVSKRYFADLFDATSDEIAQIWLALRQAARDLSSERRSAARRTTPRQTST